jgi:sialidase-1
MNSHLRSVSDRTFDIWRIPGRFTKNPDMVRLSSGRMLLVFCDVEKHWTEEVSRITLLESTDDGKTWGNPQVIAEADRRKGEERWLTPRLSHLSDGRLVVICDHDDFAHYHEDQPSGNWIWYSTDEGRTWSEPVLTGIPGIEPDRLVELADGTLLVAACLVPRDTQKEAMIVMRSTDGGASWGDLSVVAKDQVQNYTEGAIVVLSNGLLACVMRNENQNGYPSYVAFSTDQGRTWSRPRPLPFLGDRPYAKELSDGRVLITYRNKCGNTGTHAWLGDLSSEWGHQVGGTHYGDQVAMGPDALHIGGVVGGVTRFVLLPPESYRSDVVMETTLRVSGPQDQPVAKVELSRMGIALEVCSNAVWLRNERRAEPGVPGTDNRYLVDMTSYRTIRLEVRKGLASVQVDGQTVMWAILRDETPLRETWFGCVSESEGEVWWRGFYYYVDNPTEPDHLWVWQAAGGRYPDQYGLDRVMEVHANPPVPGGQRPDNGYSSWVEMPDGSIYLVDYTNREDVAPTAHLYAVRFSPGEISAV